MPKGLSAIQPQARIPELDGLRGVAILLVVISHSYIFSLLPNSLFARILGRIQSSGWMGVDIFFALSGFLITRILLSDSSDWKDFYRNRAFRILPAFLVVYLLTLWFLHYRPRLQVVACLLFLGNFNVLTGIVIPPLNHYWSLAVEEQFYLLWPQAAWRISKPALLKFALSLAGFSFLCRCVAAAIGVSVDAIYFLTPTHLDGIALGCAAAVATQLPAAREWLLMRWKVIAWAAFAALAIGAVSVKLVLTNDHVRVLLFAIPAVSALAAVLVFAAAENQLPSVLSAALRNSVLVYFGLRSYALYLIHFPMMMGLRVLRAQLSWKLIEAHPGSSLVATEIAGIALPILLAEVSWRFIEQPAQQMKRRWFERRAERSLANSL